MQKKTDRRVRKTKTQLRNGLAMLMKEKSVGEITVKELVDQVDINNEELFELKCFTNCKRLHFKFKKNRKAFTVLVSSYI